MKKLNIKVSEAMKKSGPGDPVYGGTASPKEPSNRSAVIAGAIGSAIGTIGAAIAARKAKKQKALQEKVSKDIEMEKQEKAPKKTLKN